MPHPKPSPLTLRTLRTRYRETWTCDWPHDDEHLSVLWRESKAHWQGKNNKDALARLKILEAKIGVEIREKG